MRKKIFLAIAVVGITLFAIGLFSLDTSARETELFLDLAMDIDEQEYDDTTYRMRRFKGHQGPLLFIGLGETLKEDILEQAALYNVTVKHYVLIKTVSTYDATYDFDEMISAITSAANDEEVQAYVDTWNQVLVDSSEAIKATLDALKDIYMPMVQEIRETYKDDVKALIKNIKEADEDTKQQYIDQLKALKLEIQDEMKVIQDAFLLDLEEENIAVEGLYGLFINRTQDRFKARLDMLEKRNPRLYDRIKHYFNK